MSLWEELRRKLKLGLLHLQERRWVPRRHVPGLTSYYWDGDRPSPHGVRDISESGMYVYTRERWYPGTLVLMRLEREECEEGAPEQSISVLSRVMRWGDDGVGLEFVFANQGKKPPQLADGAEKIEFQQFLAHLKSKYGVAAL